MTDLRAPHHSYRLNALRRQGKEILDIPLGDEGDNILLEDGDDLLAENADYLVSDGSAVTALSYKLSARPRTYLLTALRQTQVQAGDSFAQAFRPGVTPLSVTTFDVSLGWAYATTVPVNVLTITGYAPTVVKTEDQLVQEDGIVSVFVSGNRNSDQCFRVFLGQAGDFYPHVLGREFVTPFSPFLPFTRLEVR